MPLLNLDGTPYKASGSSQQYDPANPQHALNNLWDQEALRIGGTPIYYYESIISTGEIDTVYLECRGKLFNPNPIELQAIYEPITSQNAMTVFGFDSPNEQVFELNRQDTLAKIGHAPRLGSRLYTPHRGENWEIIQVNTGEYRGWGVLRIQIIARQFQESITTMQGKVTANVPNVQRPL